VLLLATQGVGGLSAAVFKAHLSDGWYSREPQKLKEELKKADALAAASAVKRDLDEKNGIIRAIIAPHAGYRYSSAVAAAGYRLFDKKGIKRVIILAPSHSVPIDKVALPWFDTYQTPLGDIPVDLRCIQKLKQSNLFAVHTGVWEKEHSLEVQLPFIQTYLKPDVAIVPLIIGSSMSLAQLGRAAQILKSCIDNNTVVVVSSDFTHYGSRFNYTPFKDSVDVQKSIAYLDHTIIDTIIHKKARDTAGLIEQKGATVCGRMPIIFFKLLQEKNTWKHLQGRLAAYKTSYDVMHDDPSESVSYAAIVFRDIR